MTHITIPPQPSYNASDLAQLIQSSLEDGKAQDVVVIDLKGKTSFADYMIVATGTSDRHTSALGANILDALKHQHHLTAKSEGMNEGNWVLIDAGDVVVHIFKPEIRKLYNLEKMWSAPIFDREVAHS